MHPMDNLAKETQQNIIETYSLINASPIKIISFISKSLKDMGLFEEMLDFILEKRLSTKSQRIQE